MGTHEHGAMSHEPAAWDGSPAASYSSYMDARSFPLAAASFSRGRELRRYPENKLRLAAGPAAPASGEVGSEAPWRVAAPYDRRRRTCALASS